MNSKRPEQVHYIPPQRRKHSVSIPSPLIPQPPPPNVGSIYINGSSGRMTIDSPGSKHAVPVSHHSRFEPSKTPPIRPDNTPSHSHSRSGVPRRDVYDPGMSPGMHHRDLRAGLEVYREHARPTATEPFYIDKAGVFQTPASGAAGRHGGSPAHLVRNRSYEQQDRYAEVPAPFRKQAAPAGWMDGVVKGSPAVMHPVRILRNPEREREQRERDRDRENRDFSEEHVVVSRTFAMPPRPEAPIKPRAYGVATNGSGGAFLGEKIHSLTPSTSLEERCQKFIASLNPEYPDPPEVQEHIEHPYTTPCDPSTLPPSTGSRRGMLDDDMYAPVEVVKTAPTIHVRSFVPSERDVAGLGRRGRHSGRPRYRTRHDDGYDTDEDCTQRIYRLHT
ncbi:hypothetical protein EDC01DRAFT_392376 [Geopyxis carbonaria]|nr:hypothetical protein EDC01DRAFT_392376 [Geopyxis carbonaria]